MVDRGHYGYKPRDLNKTTVWNTARSRRRHQLNPVSGKMVNTIDRPTFTEKLLEEFRLARVARKS